MLVLHNRTFLFPQKIDTEDKSYSNAHMYTCLCWKDQHRPAQPYCSSTKIACWNTSTTGIVKTKKLNIFSSSHHLLTLISLQTCLTFYLLWNIERFWQMSVFSHTFLSIQQRSMVIKTGYKCSSEYLLRKKVHHTGLDMSKRWQNFHLGAIPLKG